MSSTIRNSEKDLIKAAQQDPCAFNELYERYVRPVYRYHYRHVNNVAEAEDLTSQTFLAALEALPRFRYAGHFPGWLFTIARNKVIDFYRHNRPQAQLDEQIINPDSLDLAGEYEFNDLAARLNKLVNNLDDTEKDLIYLRYVAGLSFEDLAVVLHKNTDALKKYLYRLLARLKKQLEADDE